MALYRGEDPAQFMGKKVIPSINTAFNDNNYDYNKVDKDGASKCRSVRHW
jgi:hypothetical protein